LCFSELGLVLQHLWRRRWRRRRRRRRRRRTGEAGG
jgi:hypothetical protein